MNLFPVTIGGKTFEIQSPLKFRQLRLIEPAMSKIIGMKISGEGTSEKFYDEMANVILAAVNEVDKAFTRSDLDELPVTVDELTTAVKTISKAAGMWKEPTPGEAQGQMPPNPNQNP